MENDRSFWESLAEQGVSNDGSDEATPVVGSGMYNAGSTGRDAHGTMFPLTRDRHKIPSDMAQEGGVPRTKGSARHAVPEIGGRGTPQTSTQEKKTTSWRKTLSVMGDEGLAERCWRRSSSGSRRNLSTQRTLPSRWRRNKTGSTERQHASRDVGGDADKTRTEALRVA